MSNPKCVEPERGWREETRRGTRREGDREGRRLECDPHVYLAHANRNLLKVTGAGLGTAGVPPQTDEAGECVCHWGRNMKD